MAYYKVVKVEHGGDLVSAIVKPLYDFYFRYYRKDGQIQTVTNGLAFNDILTAKQFMIGEQLASPNYELWECTGKKILLPKKFVSVAICVNQNTIENLKRYIFYGAKYTGDLKYDMDSLVSNSNSAFPNNTVRLRNLKLIRKLDI